MRKFKVTVTREDEFEIAIDENKIGVDFIKEFESYMFNLGKDKIRTLAEHIGYNAVDACILSVEGVGSIPIDGRTSSSEEVMDGITVETIYCEDIETESREIK